MLLFLILSPQLRGISIFDIQAKVRRSNMKMKESAIAEYEKKEYGAN